MNEELKLYSSPGMKSLRSESMKDAAATFANRIARKEFGDGGYCRMCIQGAHAENSNFAEYSAFIGRSSGRNETTGRNVHLVVYKEEA
ncbi:MAG TPA: hypothetical protein VIS99_06990 [Terrimicrobiaceae bacterium]